MTTVSALLASGFDLDVDNIIPDGTGRCGICGVEGEIVKSSRLIQKATAGIADTFKHGPYACLNCAACFTANKLLRSNLLATRYYGVSPLVAIPKTLSPRPTWRDLLRKLQPGDETVAIVTSNTKRRLWIDAAVAVVGPVWRVLFVDGDTARLLKINHAKLLDVLDTVEALLMLGLSKRAIADNVVAGMKLKALKDPTLLVQLLDYEQQLTSMRDTEEFTLALFVAQKPEE
jgi:hypothetical protein